MRKRKTLCLRKVCVCVFGSKKMGRCQHTVAYPDIPLSTYLLRSVLVVLQYGAEIHRHCLIQFTNRQYSL